MAKALTLSAGLVLAGTLSACADGAVGTAHLGTYDPATLNYIASKGALYTQVIGNPFDAPKTDLDRSLTASMTGAHFGQTVRFSTERDPANRSPYRVVVLFNPGAGAAEHNLCQDQAEPGPGSGGRIHVVAALCAGDSRETSVAGRIPGASGPNDPTFRHLIRRMTAQLFPPRNPDIQDDKEFEF